MTGYAADRASPRLAGRRKRDISDKVIVGTQGKFKNRDDIMAALLMSPKEVNL